MPAYLLFLNLNFNSVFILFIADFMPPNPLRSEVKRMPPNHPLSKQRYLSLVENSANRSFTDVYSQINDIYIKNAAHFEDCESCVYQVGDMSS